MTRLVTDYLDKSSNNFPNKVAFADTKRAITFHDLQVESKKIGTSLLLNHYQKKPIAIYLDKSVECLCSFMGVAYSGNYYTDIDVSMPIERVIKIIDVLSPVAIITDYAHKDMVQNFAINQKILIYEEIKKEKIDENLINASLISCTDTDVLYVLFTSGSTGNPKGVVISHRAVISYTEWGSHTFSINSDTIFGNQTPFYFSMSVFDIYQTLRNGCTMYIIPKVNFSFPIKLLEFIAEKKINFIYWVPSALCIVANLRALGERDISCLKYVLFAGEVMPAKQYNMWKKALPNTIFANLFGPTEVTDICNYYIINRPIQDDEVIPIGGPCQNTKMIILNENNQEANKGEIGELCVAGSILAYGYYGDKNKTEQVFIQNPLNHLYPEIIYKTGDLVEYNQNNELIYKGRKDFQIKHMGHRIELGEIEAGTSSITGVESTCCLYDSRRSLIILCYTGSIEEKSLFTAIKNILPSYMIPNKRIKLKSMPLNLNGKIDRQKLKELAKV